jgi:hypothetical protein
LACEGRPRCVYVGLGTQSNLPPWLRSQPQRLARTWRLTRAVDGIADMFGVCRRCPLPPGIQTRSGRARGGTGMVRLGRSIAPRWGPTHVESVPSRPQPQVRTGRVRYLRRKDARVYGRVGGRRWRPSWSRAGCCCSVVHGRPGTGPRPPPRLRHRSRAGPRRPRPAPMLLPRRPLRHQARRRRPGHPRPVRQRLLRRAGRWWTWRGWSTATPSR